MKGGLNEECIIVKTREFLKRGLSCKLALIKIKLVLEWGRESFFGVFEFVDFILILINGFKEF